MDNKTFYTRHMLLQYGRQLISSRKIARYDRMKNAIAERDPTDSAEVKRSKLIERVSQEVVSNLMFTGNDNPVVKAVRLRLNDSMGEDLVFYYPPGEMEFQIMRKNANGSAQVSHEEKDRIILKLLELTRQTVAESML